MDPVKKETPIAPVTSADQTLVDKTGGIPGVDHSGQIDVTRKAVAENLGTPVREVTPNTEIADAEIGNFLKDVVHVQGKDEVVNTGITDSSSGLKDLGKNITDLLPEIGEHDYVETAPSGEFNELVKKREAA